MKIKFECDDGLVSMVDLETGESVWSMSLEYTDSVEEGLYELLELTSGMECESRTKITFPQIGPFPAMTLETK